MMRRISPRDAMRMMQKMGLKLEELQGVVQVIIKTANKQITIDGPTVTTLNVQGQTMYQIAGGKVSEQGLLEQPIAQIDIPEEDVQLVAQQTGKSLEDARRALRETGGDLAKAILLLQGKGSA